MFIGAILYLIYNILTITNFRYEKETSYLLHYKRNHFS